MGPSSQTSATSKIFNPGVTTDHTRKDRLGHLVGICVSGDHAILGKARFNTGDHGSICSYPVKSPVESLSETGWIGRISRGAANSGWRATGLVKR